MFSVMVIAVGNGISDPSSNSVMKLFIPFRTHVLRKDMNASVRTPDMGK